MFTNRRIRVALGRTINLGDFQSVRVDVETSCDIADDMDIQKAKNTLFGEIKAELKERCAEFEPKPKYIPKQPTIKR